MRRLVAVILLLLPSLSWATTYMGTCPPTDRYTYVSGRVVFTNSSLVCGPYTSSSGLFAVDSASIDFNNSLWYTDGSDLIKTNASVLVENLRVGYLGSGSVVGEKGEVGGPYVLNGSGVFPKYSFLNLSMEGEYGSLLNSTGEDSILVLDVSGRAPSDGFRGEVYVFYEGVNSSFLEKWGEVPLLAEYGELKVFGTRCLYEQLGLPVEPPEGYNRSSYFYFAVYDPEDVELYSINSTFDLCPFKVVIPRGVNKSEASSYTDFKPRIEVATNPFYDYPEDLYLEFYPERENELFGHEYSDHWISCAYYGDDPYRNSTTEVQYAISDVGLYAYSDVEVNITEECYDVWRSYPRDFTTYDYLEGASTIGCRWGSEEWSGSGGEADICEYEVYGDWVELKPKSINLTWIPYTRYNISWGDFEQANPEAVEVLWESDEVLQSNFGLTKFFCNSSWRSSEPFLISTFIDMWNTYPSSLSVKPGAKYWEDVLFPNTSWQGEGYIIGMMEEVPVVSTELCGEISFTNSPVSEVVVQGGVNYTELLGGLSWVVGILPLEKEEEVEGSYEHYYLNITLVPRVEAVKYVYTDYVYELGEVDELFNVTLNGVEVPYEYSNGTLLAHLGTLGGENHLVIEYGYKCPFGHTFIYGECVPNRIVAYYIWKKEHVGFVLLVEAVLVIGVLASLFYILPKMNKGLSLRTVVSITLAVIGFTIVLALLGIALSAL